MADGYVEKGSQTHNFVNMKKKIEQFRKFFSEIKLLEKLTQ